MRVAAAMNPAISHSSMRSRMRLNARITGYFFPVLRDSTSAAMRLIACRLSLPTTLSNLACTGSSASFHALRSGKPGPVLLEVSSRLTGAEISGGFDYRPVKLQPMSNDVQSFPPKARVY